MDCSQFICQCSLLRAIDTLQDISSSWRFYNPACSQRGKYTILKTISSQRSLYQLQSIQEWNWVGSLQVCLDQYKLHQDKVTSGIWNTEAEWELLQEEQCHQKMHCSSCSRKSNSFKQMLSSPLTNPDFLASPHCHSIAHASIFFLLSPPITE